MTRSFLGAQVDRFFGASRERVRRSARRYRPGAWSVVEVLESRRLLANISASATISSTPAGSHFDYSIKLSNSSQSDSSIGTFWYAWIPGQDYLASNPISVSPPTGWTDQVTHGGGSDGYAIEFVSTGSNFNVQAGASLSFGFRSADSPSSVNGNSPFFPGTPVGTSFVYPQGAFSDAGHELVVTAQATLSSIALTPAHPGVPKGSTQQFTAIGTFSDQTTANLTGQVTWSSSNTGVATINNSGLANTPGIGTSTITAKLNGVTGSTTFNVSAAVLRSIAITPANPNITPGKTTQFNATGTFSDKSTKNLTSQVTWASANTAAATIGASGLATGVAAGKSSITAKLSGITGTTGLNVLGPLRVVSVNPASGTLSALPGGHVVVTFNQAIAGIQPDNSTGGGFSAHPVAVTLIPGSPEGGFAAPTGFNTGSQPIPATLVYHVNANGTSTITLIPREPLGTNLYQVKVSGFLTGLAGNALGAAGPETTQFELKTVAPNSVPLKVNSITTLRTTVNIANNATIAQPDTIAINFNKPLDGLTVNGNTVQLLAGPAKTVVNAAVAYNPTTRTAFLTPEAILVPGTTYTIMVAGTITDNQNFPNPDAAFSLGAAVTRTFQVNSNAVVGVGPLVAKSSNGHLLATPAFGAARKTPVGYASIPFSETVDLATLGPNSVTLTPMKGGLNNSGFDSADAPLNIRVAFNPNTNTMIIVPTVLMGNDTYRYSVSNMKARNGDPLTHPGGTLPVTDTFVLAIPAAPAVVKNSSFASLGALLAELKDKKDHAG